MLITRPVTTPPRQGLDHQTLWNSEDCGLIACWERGLEKRQREPELAAKASAGELVVLAWKGGVEKPIQAMHKFGTLNYLATWQGLRGEDLFIDTEKEVMLVCSRTKMSVTFTADRTKYGES